MTKTREFTRATFTLEMFESADFEGFTDGSLWNGWSCPYFTFETAIRVLTNSEANGYRWNYDKDTDVFLVKHIDDPQDFESESFKGTNIDFEGNAIVVYAIGAFSWTWAIKR